MNTTSVATPLLRPLPRPARPFPQETIESYLTRLAIANRLDVEALRRYAAGDQRKSVPIPIERLAILAGQTEQVLRHALPDLKRPIDPAPQRFRRRPEDDRLVRVICRCCAAARGAGTVVRCYLRREDVVCLRHQRWLGDCDATPELQPSLVHQPEILAANRHHRKIIRKAGRPQAEAAYHEARWICEHWHRRFEHRDAIERMMNVFHPPGWGVFENDPTLEAAAYPQIVALTRLLASPAWRELPFGPPDQITRFEAEVKSTVAPMFRWRTTRSYGHADPLVDFFLEEGLHRTGPRPYVYRSPVFCSTPPSGELDGGDHGGLPVVAATPASSGASR